MPVIGKTHVWFKPHSSSFKAVRGPEWWRLRLGGSDGGGWWRRWLGGNGWRRRCGQRQVIPVRAASTVLVQGGDGTGVTIFLCGLAIALLGSLCLAPTVMVANFIATPIESRLISVNACIIGVQLCSLIIPFLRFGESITGGSHFLLISDAIMKGFTGEASHELLPTILRALLGWIVAAPFILAGLYILFSHVLRSLVSKLSGTVLRYPPQDPINSNPMLN